MSLSLLIVGGFILIIFLIVVISLIPFFLPRIVSIQKQWLALKKEPQADQLNKPGGTI